MQLIWLPVRAPKMCVTNTKFAKSSTAALLAPAALSRAVSPALLLDGALLLLTSP